ncbi:helix-turn-helix domain-containing protein [Streptacidiphilus fuscans]|uniref:Helix-turn-helix domain-containing protein n=1 Tax=Streptacidiphilus fuscans TaxID=2789292 RepID=A0A931FF61_9ACTN|nr:XRE family transcriptional regulator [Streptacidiphilus fuscans]MBF9069456.1 helix-turn-helix domain-containing protein [Streptacidiphilus fuscans]
MREAITGEAVTGEAVTGTGERAEPRLGGAVRRRRRTLDLTLAEVARRTGLSVPFLSQIENDRARPSMRSLQRIADGLETTAVDLLAVADAADRPVDIVLADADAGLSPDAGVRPLVRGRRPLHALEFTGDQQADREFLHLGDELMYVADGAAEVEAEGRIHHLRRGDTLYLSGGVRHRWRSLSPDTRVLVVAVSDHAAAGPPPGR